MDPNPRRAIPWLPDRALPVILLIVLVVPAILTWLQLRASRDAGLSAQTAVVASQLAHELDQLVTMRLEVVDHLRRELAAGLLDGEKDFSIRAGAIQADFPGYLAINRVDATGTIVEVVPEAQNQAALGKNVRQHPQAGPTFEQAAESGRIAVTTPLELFQGGIGFASYFPIERDGQRVGYVNGVFRATPLVQEALGTHIRELFRVTVAWKDHHVYTHGPPLDERAPLMSSAPLIVGPTTWIVRVAPSPALLLTASTTPANVLLVFGLLLAAGLAFMLRLALQRGNALRRLEERLRHQQRLEAIGTLASGVAHEINNPLTGVMSYATFLAEDAPPGSASEQRARRIIREAERVADITSKLLRFARQDAGQPGSCRPGQIVGDAVSLLRASLRADGVEVDVRVPDDLPNVACRGSEIQQVVMNLLTNARDAMVEAKDLPEEERIARVAARLREAPDGRWIRLTVSDAGPGIAKERLPHIFDPFFTTKDVGKGTGLGLAVSYGIVRDHDGRITVDTVPGQGTEFHVDLPVCTAGEMSESAA